MITMIYEDIFEAIRAFTPNHPFLSLKDSPETTVEIPKPLLFMLGVGEAPCSKFIAASKTYTDSLIQLPMPRTFEEAFIRMGNDIPTHYFRGENCTVFQQHSAQLILNLQSQDSRLLSISCNCLILLISQEHFLNVLKLNGEDWL